MPVNISRIQIDMPPERVWDVVTKAELVKQWQFGSDLITDWSVGGAIRFRTEWEGNIFEQWGTVLEFKPNKLLRYSLFAPRPDLQDIPEHYFEMAYHITEKDGQTELQIIQTDNRPGAVQEPEQGAENQILYGLKTLAES